MLFLMLVFSVLGFFGFRQIQPANLQTQAGPPPFFSTGVNVGTGFFVDQEGDIATAGHVVEVCRAVRVAGDGFDAEPAKVVAIDRGYDVALLRVQIRAPAVLQIAAGIWGNSEKTIRQALRKSEFGSGSTMGYPGWSVSVVTSPVQLPPSVLVENGKGGILHFYRAVEGKIVSGQSGSPILYEDGKVAGVLAQGNLEPGVGATTSDGLESKIGYFVAGPIVEAFAGQNGIKLAAKPAGNPHASIVHVFCFTGY